MSVDIVVTGSVATGKTYLQNALRESFPDAKLYPEFIYQDSFALEILRRRFRREVSALTFQNFILDKWDLLAQKERGDGIAIYERLPDDAVEVFSKMSLTPEEYTLHEKWLSRIPILSYKDMHADDTVWIVYENRFDKPIAPLISLVKEYMHTRKHIVIEVQSSTSYDNYKHRNRKGEDYTPEELEILYNKYLEYTALKRDIIGCQVINM